MHWLNQIRTFLAGHFKKASPQPPDEGTKPWVRNRNSGINSLTAGAGIEETGATKILKRLPSPKAMKWIFQVVAGVDRGREYIGFTKEIRVGRHPENFILLRDPKVSRFHALFYLKGAKLFLEDLGSTNGTKVNGVKVSKKIQVFPGDQIKLGETVIQITLDKD